MLRLALAPAALLAALATPAVAQRPDLNRPYDKPGQPDDLLVGGRDGPDEVQVEVTMNHPKRPEWTPWKRPAVLLTLTTTQAGFRLKEKDPGIEAVARPLDATAADTTLVTAVRSADGKRRWVVKGGQFTLVAGDGWRPEPIVIKPIDFTPARLRAYLVADVERLQTSLDWALVAEDAAAVKALIGYAGRASAFARASGLPELTQGYDIGDYAGKQQDGFTQLRASEAELRQIAVQKAADLQQAEVILKRRTFVAAVQGLVGGGISLLSYRKGSEAGVQVGGQLVRDGLSGAGWAYVENVFETRRAEDLAKFYKEKELKQIREIEADLAARRRARGGVLDELSGVPGRYAGRAEETAQLFGDKYKDFDRLLGVLKKRLEADARDGLVPPFLVPYR